MRPLSPKRHRAPGGAHCAGSRRRRDRVGASILPKGKQRRTVSLERRKFFRCPYRKLVCSRQTTDSERITGFNTYSRCDLSRDVVGRVGAKKPHDLERVAVDTTVQPKAVAHPTDARLMHRALVKRVGLAKRFGVPLRQNYRRVAKRAAIMVGRYTHAHQFRRARRALKFLRTRLGRVIRDIERRIDGTPALADRFQSLLQLARRIRFQDHRQRGPKVYSLHAPEVECIGKGKARAPYEFGCKVSIVTPVTAPKGGQFVLHAKALHGNPFDGHSLGPVIADLEKLTGVETRRIHLDKGYRGHNHPHKFRVWISGQVRRVTAPIRREMRRRAAIEPVIGHLKAEHRMERNYLKGRDGDPANAVLAAAGYNFGLLLRWLERISRALIAAVLMRPLP